MDATDDAQDARFIGTAARQPEPRFLREEEEADRMSMTLTSFPIKNNASTTSSLPAMASGGDFPFTNDCAPRLDALPNFGEEWKNDADDGNLINDEDADSMQRPPSMAAVVGAVGGDEPVIPYEDFTTIGIFCIVFLYHPNAP